MKIISHRGAAGLALENSLESITAALKLPVYAIEVDIRQTKDNVLVLSHDYHTGRVAKKIVRISEVTLAELQKITLKDGGKVATLKEALDLIGTKKPVVLDIKVTGIAEQIVTILNDYPDTEFCLTGRHSREMKKVFDAKPDTTFFVQSFLNPFDPIQVARAIGAHGISLNMWLMNPLTYYLAKRYNLTVRLYTVNHPLLVKFMHVLYPDAEIFTNHPHKYAKPYTKKHESS